MRKEDWFMLAIVLVGLALVIAFHVVVISMEVPCDTNSGYFIMP